MQISFPTTLTPKSSSCRTPPPTTAHLSLPPPDVLAGSLAAFGEEADAVTARLTPQLQHVKACGKRLRGLLELESVSSILLDRTDKVG